MKNRARVEFRLLNNEESLIREIMNQNPEYLTMASVLRAGIHTLKRELELKNQCRFSQVMAFNLSHCASDEIKDQFQKDCPDNKPEEHPHGDSKR